MWYKSTITFVQQDDKGQNIKRTQQYLFDAVSYTDAEARTYQYCAEELKEFSVTNITKQTLNELFFIESAGDIWFKVKVSYIVFDERSAKEKRVPFHFMLNAIDVKETHDMLVSKLGTVQDYFIESIVSTAIVDVIPYIAPDETATA